jgi:hypothetical protein
MITTYRQPDQGCGTRGVTAAGVLISNTVTAAGVVISNTVPVAIPAVCRTKRPTG